MNAPLARPKRSLRTAVLLALLLFAVDGLVLGQGGITAFALMGVVLFSLPLTLLAWKNRPLLAFRAKKTGVYLLAIAAVFGWVFGNRALADQRGRALVAAVEAYAAKHQRFPDTLQQLVPEFIPSIPLAKYALILNYFEYRKMPGNTHWLTWTVIPPFGRQNYVFEERRWSYLD